MSSGNVEFVNVQNEVNRWRLTIPGEPIAKGRPRLATVGGHARAFTPAKTRRYEDIVRQYAVREWGRPMLDGVCICLHAEFVRAIPASWSKRKRADALAGALHPIGRPDLDNCIKSVTDALNGVVYADDALICVASARKSYGDPPRVEVTLTWRTA